MSQTNVETVVAQAQAAQAEFEAVSQEVVDELLVGLAWAVLEPDTNRSLAEQAVRDTGLGNVEDKIIRPDEQRADDATLSVLSGSSAL